MILVTGGTGLVGGHLLYRFRESGKKIRAIYRTTSSQKKTLNIFQSYGQGKQDLMEGIEWVKADLLNLQEMEAALQGITTVYHCAASLGEGMDLESLKTVNVEGTARLVDLCLAGNVTTLCHVSSISALGPAPNGKLVDEDCHFDIEQPNTDYAISKHGAEIEAWRGSEEGLDVVIVNPGVIMGEGLYDSGSGQIISKSAKGQPFYTTGSTGVVDVKDVVKAMIRLTEGGHYGGRFILVSENIKIRKLLNTTAEFLGAKKPRIKIPQPLLSFLSMLSSVYHLFTSKHFMSRGQVRSLTSDSRYDNSKYLNEVTSSSFNPVNETLQRVTQHYQQSQ